MAVVLNNNPAKPSMFSHPFSDWRAGAHRGLVYVKL